MTDPIAVLPLPYESPADRDADGLVAVVRGVSWLLAVGAGVGLAEYALAVACYAWQQATLPPGRPRLIDGWPLVWGVPAAALTAVMIAAAVDCRRLRDAGRRRVVAIAAVNTVLGPALRVLAVAYSYETRDYPRFGPAFVAYTAGATALSAAYGVAASAAVWLFFRHPAVRRRFAPP